MSFRDMMAGLVSTDRAAFAAEFTSAVSFGLWAIFPGVNVDDDLRATMNEAHGRAFPEEPRPVWEHWQDVAEQNDPIAMSNTFMSPLKGTAAELHVRDQLNAQGWDVELAQASNQPGWDLHGTNPTGDYTQIQVKGGESYTASDIQEHMDRFPAGDPNHADHYVLSTEVYDRYVESGADSGGRNVTEFGAEAEGAQGIGDGPETPSANEGADVAGGSGAEAAGGTGTDMAGGSGAEAAGGTGTDVAGGSGAEAAGGTGTDVAGGSGAEAAGGTGTDMAGGSGAEAGGGAGTDVAGGSGEAVAGGAAAGPGGRTLTDIGSDYEQVESIEDGLNTLSANEGIDVPDGAVEMLPYVGAIWAGARLIQSVLETESQFKAADRTTKNRIQVVQTLTLMSRMGVTTVMSAIGGTAGAAAGSAVPGVGSVVAGVGGALAGAFIGSRHLNRRLQPRMLDLALDITGLTHDDLFYYKNKTRIDGVALSFQTRAGELAALPC